MLDVNHICSAVQQVYGIAVKPEQISALLKSSSTEGCKGCGQSDPFSESKKINNNTSPCARKLAASIVEIRFLLRTLGSSLALIEETTSSIKDVFPKDCLEAQLHNLDYLLEKIKDKIDGAEIIHKKVFPEDVSSSTQESTDG